MEKIGNIFFTSDTHFHHKNIVRGTSEWLLEENKGPTSFERTRDFNTLEEHDEVIINSLSSQISSNWPVADYIRSVKDVKAATLDEYFAQHNT